MTAADRAIAALTGLAIGDALGMPTQLMSRAAVRERFGVIDGFLGAGHDHPIAAGMAAGSITDDTEQALLLAHHLIARGGRVDARAFALELVAWEDRMRERGSLDLLGPSTRAAVAAVVEGASPDDTGRAGSTNGAAMRVTPVGIAVAPDDLEALVDRVVEASRVTHHTTIAIAGASAVAAAVSAGIAGATTPEATELAIRAARIGATRGHWIAGGLVAERIELALELAADGDVARIVDVIGSSLATQESVPAAFAMLALGHDAWTVVTAAAGLGGDSDTIAAMAGAIAGACGWTFPAEAIDTIARVNRLDLAPVALDLLALR